MASRYVAVLACIAVASQSAVAQSITVSAQPVVSIGKVEGDPAYLLNEVGSVRRLSDGRILVTMGPEIRFYDSAGRYLADAGGRGGGPGRFQYIRDLVVLPGDTLLVLDFRARVWLTSHGKYVRQETMDLTPLASDGWVSEGARLLPSGNLLASQYRRETPGDRNLRGLFRPILRYSVFDLESKTVTSLIVSGGARQMRLSDGDIAPQAFTPSAQSAIGLDRIYVGDNDTTFVSAYTLSGELLDTVQVADEPTPVTVEDLNTYHDAVLEQLRSDPLKRTMFERVWAAVPKPKRHPYWNRVVVDIAGHLWISSPEIPTRSVTWTVLDRSGKRLSIVVLPRTFEPKEIGLDYILGVARDEVGVEYVRMYRIARSTR